jgi:FKBP-type peptidyl-prolyl cis-trans isomerase
MPPMRKGLLSIAAFLLVLLAVGCGSGSSSSDSSAANSQFRIPIPGGKAPVRYEAEMKVGKDGLVDPEPKPVFPQGPAPDFTALVDQIEGIGELHYEGDPVTVQFVGYDYETHKKFASSWNEGKPFTFTLGKGEVIEGWEEGLQEIENGDRRELVVPASETKGPFPKGIPSGHAVIFVVESVPTKPVSERKGKEESAAQKPGRTYSGPKKTKPKVAVPSGPPPKKLEIKDLEKGSGPGAKPGDEVSVQYVGVDYKSGKEFDASWDRGEPFPFQLGSHSVIEGWEQGLKGMKVGGRRELIIPPQLGYGSQSNGAIPANETLVFVIDLEAIN